jgi:methylmalonyl-CoA mutase N-terminal domain/subunit
MSEHLSRFTAFKSARSRSAVRSALSGLARAANSKEANVFAAVVDAAATGVTHGEIVACLRSELGFGNPLIAA